MEVSPFAIRHSLFASLDLPRLFRQHDRNAVANGISELGRARDQFLPGRIEFERALGHRTDQDLQQLWIDGAVEAFGRCAHLLSPDRPRSLEHASTELKHARRSSSCLSMIFSENRCPLFRIMLYFYCVTN